MAIGGALYREAIVEYDAAGGRLRLHDPARWVRPDGYYRSVLDDDGDRPVAILKRRAETLRVVAGASAVRALTLAVESAERVGFPPESRIADGMRWGPAALPPLDLVPRASGFDPGRGDDGFLSSGFLLRFRAILDMPHRWAYLKPETGAPPKRGLGAQPRTSRGRETSACVFRAELFRLGTTFADSTPGGSPWRDLRRRRFS